MYKVDIQNKQLIKLTPATFGKLNLKERYDVEEWIEKTPEILGEELLIIGKELSLPSGRRLDLLAIDKRANIAVIELKKDDSGADVEWQAIKYTSYCSNFLPEDIFKYYAQYIQSDEDTAQLKIEKFIDEEIEKLNENQRIILVSKEFHQDVISAVLWLREFGIDIKCIRLELFLDQENQLLITPDIIIPLPEAKDYLEKKETKQKEAKRSLRSSFSLERSNLKDDELEKVLSLTLNRISDLTPRLVVFLDIVSSEERVFNREEVKSKLFQKGIGADIGQSGRYLSNISQFLTKKSNPHLRQIVEFKSGGAGGEKKDNYSVVPQYLELLRKVLKNRTDRREERKDS